MSSNFDLMPSQFSPEGRIHQVEYAEKAAQKSGTVIGLRGKDGVVLAVEKLLTSSLYEQDSGRRIFTINANIGMAVAGLTADGFAVAEKARQEATNHHLQFGKPITINHMCDRIAAYMHAYTVFSSTRPFGLTVTLAGWDEIVGPQLFKIDSSGVAAGYLACASGLGEQKASPLMKKYKFSDMPLDSLVQTAGSLIYQVHNESSDKDFCFEMGLVGKDTDGLHCINPDIWIALAVESGLRANKPGYCG
ncbi:proteasome subunit alpha type-3-like [Scaptodrosophila lebanonensis]|uniref:Proteasome subunit alpha type n=1 Tax=Drosophila lebanonensis TaxID=7225 RepID=A0A6J2U9F3_DROLE|nr:proteasome subunit alpha type-3-like [Scaptodrosophila lebanonensis]